MLLHSWSSGRITLGNKPFRTLQLLTIYMGSHIISTKLSGPPSYLVLSAIKKKAKKITLAFTLNFLKTCPLLL